MAQTLTAPGVYMSVEDDSAYSTNSVGTTPLIVFASRGNKVPAGSTTGIASSTAESGIARLYTSQRDVLQRCGNPSFINLDGAPVHGDETNEYGLHALWSFLGSSGAAYGLRADVDLGQLVPSADEPVGPPADGAYWINSSGVTGGIFRRNSANTAWVSAPFSVYTTQSPGPSDGTEGNWAFDYSTTAGTLKVKTGGVKATGSYTFTAQPAANDTITINSIAVTFVTSGATGNQVNLGANLTATLTALASFLNASVNGSLSVASYSSTSTKLKITYKTIGTAGNSFTLASSQANAVASGSTLTGGAAAGWTAYSDSMITAAVIQTLTPTNTMWISDTAPTGAAANDYWWKTANASGGLNLGLTQYSATSGIWSTVSVFVGTAAPSSPTAGSVWNDISGVRTNGNRPLYVYDGAQFNSLTFFVQATAPSSAPTTGTLWFDDSIADFAMYQQQSNAWTPIVTATTTSPSSTQKVISANAPASPSVNALWVDVSTPANIDNYPVIKRWNGANWEDISASVSITDVYTAPNLVSAGSYWINLGDPTTTNTVKSYDPTYTPTILDNTGAITTPSTPIHWKPVAGKKFGRQAQRYMVVTALQAAVVNNDSIRGEGIQFQLIACPGYPELYDEMVSLNVDINQTAHVVFDGPARMIPTGTPVGKEVLASDWVSNANGASTTGELGFTSSQTPYASMAYPWALSTNTDGTNVFVPSSTVMLATFAYNDQVAYPWFAAMGSTRGIVTNASAVGYLTDAGDFKELQLNPGQVGAIYTLCINPIVFYQTDGLLVMGNKSFYNTNTAMNRVNVARLVSKMQVDARVMFRPYLGEPNDAKTWRAAKNISDKYLAGLMAKRAVYDYASRVDENNNDATAIANHILNVDWAIKPEQSVEFVVVALKVYNYGDQFK